MHLPEMRKRPADPSEPSELEVVDRRVGGVERINRVDVQLVPLGRLSASVGNCTFFLLATCVEFVSVILVLMLLAFTHYA